VSGLAEIIVVDNGSVDESRRVIEEARSYLPQLLSVLLDENAGGEAVNLCFEKVSGELIHISENDLVYLPGWADHVRTAFCLFSNLGKLSLFGATSLDAHPRWFMQLSRLGFANGKILYNALGNVGTCSVRPLSIIMTFGFIILLPADIAPPGHRGLRISR